MKKNILKFMSGTLIAFLTASMLFSATVSAATPTGARLKTIPKGVMVGTELSSGFTGNDSTFFNTFTPEFNLVTAENCMKWDGLEPSQNSFNWSEGDKLVNWAKQNNYTVHGHTFVWYNQTPSWVQNLSASAMESAMYNHIDKVMAHYKGQIPIWDVANECFEDNGTYRNSFWYRTMGKSYIEKAFTHARAADPSVKLVYNDYNLEYTGAKSNAAYEMLKDFKSRGIPVDGIGFQMHLDIQYAIDYEDFAKNMQRFADLGLEIYITEMDVRVSSNTNSTELEKQASYYKNIIEKCMAQPAVKAIQFWGFTDKYSWVPGTFSGRDNALLFDKSYNPKPAYYAVQKALATQPIVIPTVVYGDVDGSGSVDALDYSLMKQYLIGSITKFPGENGLKAADVDASGTIDALDLANIKKFLLGTITKFPAGA